MTDERMFEINFILSRKLAENGDNPYSLKFLAEDRIRELGKKTEISEEEVEEFIPKFRKAMKS